ncbi:MAG: trypsin-like peptidase domain-containing protein [Pseudomonadota bacterium]
MNTRHWLAAAGCMVGILGLLSCIPASQAEEKWDLAEMARQIDQTNVVVGVGGDGFCSGTLISTRHRLVLTASHCVTDRITREQREFVDPVTGEVTKKIIEKKLDLEVWQNVTREYQVISSRHYVVKIAGNDADNDVALLQILDGEFKAPMEAPLAPESHALMRGQTIYVVGNPGVVLDNSVTKGIVSSTERTLDVGGKRLKVFQIDAASIGGNSGGSVLNERGELVGTLDAGLRGTGINFAVPISATRALLRRSGFGDIVSREAKNQDRVPPGVR